MKSLPVLLSVLFLSISSISYAGLIKLTDGLKSKAISVGAVSTNGGFMGKGIELALTNNTQHTVQVYIDPAMIFVPKDTNYQNLVLLGNEYITMVGGETKAVKLQTYCGKSYAHAPHRGLEYKYWQQGDSNMIYVLDKVKRNRISATLAQSAVWMFTNNHCVSSVFDYNNPDVSRNFVSYICDRLNIIPPQYFVRRKINENETDRPVYLDGSDTTYVDIHWNFAPKRNLHVCIFDSKGEQLEEIVDNETISKEGHTVIATFPPDKYPEGTYYVRLFDDDNSVYINKKVYVGRRC